MAKNTNKSETATGSCQICERTCKLPKGMTSLHGYKRPGCGWINGSCPGAYELPYEQSCDKLKWYLAEILLARRTHLTEQLAQLTDGSMMEITIVRHKRGTRNETEVVTYRRGELVTNEWGCQVDEFAWAVRGRISNIESELRYSLAREIERVTKRIAAWK